MCGDSFQRESVRDEQKIREADSGCEGDPAGKLQRVWLDLPRVGVQLHPLDYVRSSD